MQTLLMMMERKKIFYLTLTKKHTSKKWMQDEMRLKDKGVPLNTQEIIDYMSL